MIQNNRFAREDLQTSYLANEVFATTLICIMAARTILMSLTMTGFHCSNSDFSLRGPPFSFLFICCGAYLLVLSHRISNVAQSKKTLSILEA
jgi:hypothetical protein